MKRRPKLSLEPDQQVRREPPKGFSSADRADPIAAEEAPRSVDRSDRPSGPKSPQPGRDTGTAPPYHRPPPRPSTKETGKTSPAPQPVRRTRIDRASLVKILLVAGIAALSILVLKRRFF